MPLGDYSRYEVEEAIRVELLKILTDEGDTDTLVNLYDVIVAVWRGRGVPQRPNG